MENSDTPHSGPEPDGSGTPLERINSYALVAYIPGELARFLDDLRRELVPGSLPRAHVTILPPRPVYADFEESWRHISSRLKDQPAFEIRTGGVELFENTGVVYVSLASGHAELTRMHDALNDGPLQFSEPYNYHPHITVAQGLIPEDVEPVLKLARVEWELYRGPRSFDVEAITYVQNTAGNRWLDLAELRLGPVAVS